MMFLCNYATLNKQSSDNIPFQTTVVKAFIYKCVNTHSGGLFRLLFGAAQ